MRTRMPDVIDGKRLGRIAKAEEVVATATWLCSDAAFYVTGAVVPVDGGMTL